MAFSFFVQPFPVPGTVNGIMYSLCDSPGTLAQHEPVHAGHSSAELCQACTEGARQCFEQLEGSCAISDGKTRSAAPVREPYCCCQAACSAARMVCSCVQGCLASSQARKLCLVSPDANEHVVHPWRKRDCKRPASMHGLLVY